MYDIRWCFLDDVSSWVLAGCLPSSWIFSEIILVLVLENPTDKCWDVVNCAGTDGRRGLDEVRAKLIVYRHSVCISVSQYTTDYFAFCAQIMDR